MQNGTPPHVLGELARPLVHEYNNFLNTLLLEIALLERTLPASQRDNIGILKKHARNITLLTQQWQSWKRTEVKWETVDLRSAFLDYVREFQVENVAIEIPEGEWRVRSHPLHLRSLMFLLFQAINLAQGDVPQDTSLQLVRDADSVKVRVTPFPKKSEVSAEDLFAPEGNRPGSLCLAAVKSLAERVHVNTELETGPEGTLALILEFPVASL